MRRVVAGQYEGSWIIVIHGCPELSRSTYPSNGGSLNGFRIGECHNLRVVRSRPEFAADASVMDDLGSPELPRMWAVHVDLVR